MLYTARDIKLLLKHCVGLAEVRCYSSHELSAELLAERRSEQSACFLIATTDIAFPTVMLLVKFQDNRHHFYYIPVQNPDDDWLHPVITAYGTHVSLTVRPLPVDLSPDIVGIALVELARQFLSEGDFLEEPLDIADLQQRQLAGCRAVLVARIAAREALIRNIGRIKKYVNLLEYTRRKVDIDNATLEVLSRFRQEYLFAKVALYKQSLTIEECLTTFSPRMLLDLLLLDDGLERGIRKVSQEQLEAVRAQEARVSAQIELLYSQLSYALWFKHYLNSIPGALYQSSVFGQLLELSNAGNVGNELLVQRFSLELSRRTFSKILSGAIGLLLTYSFGLEANIVLFFLYHLTKQIYLFLLKHMISDHQAMVSPVERFMTFSVLSKILLLSCCAARAVLSKDYFLLLLTAGSVISSSIFSVLFAAVLSILPAVGPFEVARRPEFSNYLSILEMLVWQRLFLYLIGNGLIEVSLESRICETLKMSALNASSYQNVTDVMTSCSAEWNIASFWTVSRSGGELAVQWKDQENIFHRRLYDISANVFRRGFFGSDHVCELDVTEKFLDASRLIK